MPIGTARLDNQGIRPQSAASRTVQQNHLSCHSNIRYLYDNFRLPLSAQNGIPLRKLPGVTALRPVFPHIVMLYRPHTRMLLSHNVFSHHDQRINVELQYDNTIAPVCPRISQGVVILPRPGIQIRKTVAGIVISLTYPGPDGIITLQNRQKESRLPTLSAIRQIKIRIIIRRSPCILLGRQIVIMLRIRIALAYRIVKHRSRGQMRIIGHQSTQRKATTGGRGYFTGNMHRFLCPCPLGRRRRPPVLP